MDWSPYFALYLGTALAMLFCGIWFYARESGSLRRLGARLILSAIVWPLVATFIIGWTLTKTPRILRDIIATAKGNP